MNVLKAQHHFARLAVAAIVAAALILTYEGTVRFAQDHGALGWRGWVIAAMNDLAVLVGILWPERPLQAIAALCSGLTIWANVDHAGDGFAGKVIALVPPVLAILLVMALEALLRKPHPQVEIEGSVTTIHDEIGALFARTTILHERLEAMPDITTLLAEHRAEVTRIAEAMRQESRPARQVTPRKQKAIEPPNSSSTTDSGPRKRYAPNAHPKYPEWELAQISGKPWEPEDMQAALGPGTTFAAARSRLQRWERFYAEQREARGAEVAPDDTPVAQGTERAEGHAPITAPEAAGDPSGDR